MSWEMNGLEFESRVNGYHAKRQILIAAHLKACCLHACDQLVLTWKLANRLDQVLIRGAVLGYQLTHGRDDVEGVGVVELANQRILDMAELQTHEAAACHHQRQAK